MKLSVNTQSNKGPNMRLDEIKPRRAAEQRVGRLKANAKAAKDRAKQLKSQADTGAEQLKVKQSREKLKKINRSSLTSMIKPYH